MSTRLTVPLLALLAVPLASPAQQLDPPDFVRSLYLRYAGIDPDRGIIDVWVRELAKGTSAAEVHAQILGSNQTFDAARKSNDAWLRLLYLKVLGREPDAAGLRGWQDRLQALRYDRVKLAREFLRSAGSELNSGGNRPGLFPPADRPAALKSSAQLLFQSVDSEFPGFQNFVVRSQADSFYRAVVANQTILADRDRSPARYAEAVRSLAAGLSTLEATVAQSRLPAANTRLYIEQCKQTLDAFGDGVFLPSNPIFPPVIGGGLPDGGYRPGIGFPPVSGGDRLSQGEVREYRNLLNTLSKDLTSAETTLRIVVSPGWATTQLLNRVDDIRSEVEKLRDDLRGGIGRADFGERVRGIAASAGTVTTALTNGRVDVRAVQAWYTVTRSLTAITDPQLSDPPGLPGGGRVPAEAIRAADEAAAECDALIVAFTPYSTYNRSVGRLISSLQDQKNRYSALRRAASGVFPTKRELDTHLDAIAASLRTVNQNWRVVITDRNLANAPDLTDLTVADREVTRQFAAVK